MTEKKIQKISKGNIIEENDAHNTKQSASSVNNACQYVANKRKRKRIWSAQVEFKLYFLNFDKFLIS